MLWGEFDAATQAHGLHTPGGRVTTTGLGGFTTGGGYGWTSSKYGLACDNLSRPRSCSPTAAWYARASDEHADLFWGIRGGGGNFGIVTEFEFRLHPLGPIVLAGLAMFPIDRARTSCAAGATGPTPRPTSCRPACRGHRAAGGVRARRSCTASRCSAYPCSTSAIRKPERAAVQPLKDLGPAVDHIGPMPYTAFQAVSTRCAPWDLGSFYARGEYMPGLGDAAIEVFLAHAADLVTLSPPFSQMIIFRIGQGVAAVPGEATAFSHRDARYLFHPITAWLDPADGEKMIAATRAFAAAMRPFSTGASYLNFTPRGRPGPRRLRRR